MTHEREHVIIHKISAPVTFHAEDPPGKLKVWHIAVGLLCVGILIGLAC